MSTISQKIRHKRYPIFNNSLILEIKTPSNNVVQFIIRNLSVSGIGATTDDTGLLDQENFQAKALFQHATISSPSKELELPLGRVATRGLNQANGDIGFFLIDNKLPLDSQLSKYIDSSDSQSILPYETELDPYQFDLATFSMINENANDIFSRCHQFSTFFGQWQQTPLYLYNTVRLPSYGSRVNLSLKRRGRGRNDFINMCSNDYLNMASHPKVLAAAKKALDEYGFGPTGSPVATGLTQYHEELSQYLAKQYGKEKVMLFSSGYAANVGSFTCLARENDLLIADFFAHASIQDGLSLSSATTHFFRHNNMEHLEKILKKYRHQHAGCMIISEGIFSMGGDTCPLDEIIDLAKHYQARVFIDEAHSYGLLGNNQLGITDHYDLIEETDLIMGAFSKVCGGHGGFLAGDKAVLDWISMYGRSLVFSAAFPAVSAAAVLTAIKLVFEEEPERLQALDRNIRHFVQGLREIGYLAYDETHKSAIVPVIIGDEHVLAGIMKHLVENGVFVVPVIYPAVARNKSLLRFTISSEHTVSDLDFVLHVLSQGLKSTNFCWT